METSDMAIRCMNCGLDNRDVAQFCRQCGTRLLAPRAAATVSAMCSNAGQQYALVFDRIGDGPWVLRRTETEAPVESTSDEDFRLQEIAWDRARIRPCPHCTNLALMQCGKCGQISCHPGTEKGAEVRCAWCGARVRIQGYIRQLNGKQLL